MDNVIKQKPEPFPEGSGFLLAYRACYPPMNSRIMEVAGISRSLTGVK